MRLLKKLLPLLLSFSMVFSISPLKTLVAGAYFYNHPGLISTAVELSEIQAKILKLNKLLNDPPPFISSDMFLRYMHLQKYYCYLFTEILRANSDIRLVL
ncbi:MAG: hypothetical protein LBJ95_01595 [Oscillospiraceae bacterium]|nr:hypothetical protein [Oscillospiraceae bacterium]